MWSVARVKMAFNVKYLKFHIGYIDCTSEHGRNGSLFSSKNSSKSSCFQNWNYIIINRRSYRSVFYLNLLVIMQNITNLRQQAALYESKRAMVHVFVNVKIRWQSSVLIRSRPAKGRRGWVHRQVGWAQCADRRGTVEDNTLPWIRGFHDDGN